ncbi:MAG: PDZ domain-containing protein [Nitrospirae bacterium]|nr:PDZ domain-containing protein [Nitrospirota bacterium]
MSDNLALKIAKGRMKDLIRKFEPLAVIAVILIAVYIFFFYPVNSKIGFGNARNNGEFEQEGQTNVMQNNRALIALQRNQADPNLDPNLDPNNIAGNPPMDQVEAPQPPWKGDSVKNPIDTFQNPVTIAAMADKKAALERDPFGLKQAAVTQPPFPIMKGQGTPAKTLPVTVPEKLLQEGHWIGLEVVPLTKALAKANKIPTKIDGVLVDEVTLLSAEVGLLAGDVIASIDGVKVTDLKSFREATRAVANIQQALVKVYRNGSYYDISVFGPDVLGIAQMEAAQMINPTSPSPHGYYGPCTKCHTLTNGPLNTGQLSKDMGDQLLKTPPPIRWGAEAPHRNRGICTDCHTLI